MRTDQVFSQRWVVVGLWFVCSVSGFMVVSTLGILLPSISSDLGLSPSQQGLVGSAAFLGNLFLAIPLGWWSSRFGPKILTTVTLVLGTLFIFLQGWSPVFVVLIVGRLAFGLSTLAREPARAILLQQWFSEKEFVFANAISNVLFGVVVGGGMIATPFILDAFGDNWRLTLYIYGAYFGVLTLLWMALGKERQTEDSRSRLVSKEAIRMKDALMHRDLWIAGIGFAGVMLSWAAFLSFYPTLMLDTYEISLRWSGGILALSIFVGGVAGLGVGYVVMARDMRKSFLQVFGILMTLSYMGMILVDSIPVLVVMGILNGVAWGFFPILYTVPFWIRGIRPREVAVALAFITVTLSVGAVVGPLSVGFLQSAFDDLRIALFIVSIPSMTLFVSGILMRRPVAEEAPRSEAVPN